MFLHNVHVDDTIWETQGVCSSVQEHGGDCREYEKKPIYISSKDTALFTSFF